MRLAAKRQTVDLAAIALGAGLLVAAASAARAAPVNLPLGQAVRVNVAGAATAVVVGNPQIADVTVIDSRTLFITGRSYGGTNIIALDRYGQTVFAGDVVVVSQPSGVQVYRGSTRTEMACAPSCTAVNVMQGGGGSGGSSPTSPAQTASGVAGANVAAGVVSNAMRPSVGAMSGVGEAVISPPPS